MRLPREVDAVAKVEDAVLVREQRVARLLAREAGAAIHERVWERRLFKVVTAVAASPPDKDVLLLVDGKG